MMRHIPLVLAFLASVYVGFLFSPDSPALWAFSTTILLALTLALLIRLACRNNLYSKLEAGSAKGDGA